MYASRDTIDWPPMSPLPEGSPHDAAPFMGRLSSVYPSPSSTAVDSNASLQYFGGPDELDREGLPFYRTASRLHRASTPDFFDTSAAEVRSLAMYSRGTQLFLREEDAGVRLAGGPLMRGNYQHATVVDDQSTVILPPAYGYF